RILAYRGHLEGAERLRRLALQLKAGQLLDGDVVRARRVGRISDQHVQCRRCAAETSGSVDGVAKRRVLEALMAAHVAHNRRTRVDADAPGNRGETARGELGLERRRSTDQVIRASNREQGMVLL